MVSDEPGFGRAFFNRTIRRTQCSYFYPQILSKRLFNRYWIHTQSPSIPSPDPDQLQVKGPSLQIEISISAILATYFQSIGQPIPSPMSGLALIDTGATFTSIDEDILNALGIRPVGSTPVQTPSGVLQQRGIFTCQFSFPGTPIPVFPFANVVGSTLKPQGIVALIGRDLLRNFLLIYDGVHGSWTLSF